MAVIPGTDDGDVLTDTDASDIIIPGGGNDHISLASGRDVIEIRPGEGHDIIAGYFYEEDYLDFIDFTAIYDLDSVRPFLTHNERGDTIIDLSAAEGLKPGSQVLILETDFPYPHPPEPEPEPEPPPEPPVLPDGTVDEETGLVVHTAKPAKIEIAGGPPLRDEEDIFPINFGNDFNAIPDYDF